MGFIELRERIQPDTPAAGVVRIFADSNTLDRPKSVDSAGVSSQLNKNFSNNILVNGSFDIVQRLATALTNIPSPSTTNRVYTADRWAFTVGNVTTPQFAQIDTIASGETGITARYYGQYKQLTNAAKFIIGQVVEGLETIPLVGRTVRFSIKARYSVLSTSPATKSMRMGLIINTGTIDAPTAGWISAFNGTNIDPTLGASLSYLTPVLADGGVIIGKGVDIKVSINWTRFSATFVVPTTAKNIIPVVWCSKTGVASDDFLITECMLTDGPEIYDWQPNPIAIEFERCQRFYCKTFLGTTVPAQNAGNNGVVYWGAGVATGSSGTWGGWQFPVRMNKTPGTITTYCPNAASAQAWMYSATAAACTATATTGACDLGVQFTTTTPAGGVIGSVVGIHCAADAEL